jgi:alcohol dehydrogenase
MSSKLGLEDIYADFSIPEHVRSFEHAPGTRVRFGPGILDSIGQEGASLGQRAMIVTDEGLVEAGYVGRAVRALAAAGLEVTVFSSVHENPTTADVRSAVKAAQDAEIDLLIGLGGGSSMDCAKGCNFILTNGGEMKDYWGKEKATKPMLPLIAVPTTAGTGSECQSFALIADEHTYAKMACGDKKAAAKVALLDPELTLSQPSRVTAVTAIDAMSHAIESYVSKSANDISRSYALAGFQLMQDAIERIATGPKNLLGRARMQLGAAMAGTAIENSMLGAAHSMANPLTAQFDIVHGQAVGTSLPAVIRRNAEDAEVAALYRDLLPSQPLDTWITTQVANQGLATTLSELNVDRDKLPQLAEEASKQWTAQFNPIAFTADDFEQLYLNCY